MYMEIIQDLKQKKVTYKTMDKGCLKNLIGILKDNKEYFVYLMQNFGCRLDLKIFKPNTEITKYIYYLQGATKEDLEQIIKDMEACLHE